MGIILSTLSNKRVLPFILLQCLVFLCTYTKSIAQTHVYWNGNVSADYFDANNWTPATDTKNLGSEVLMVGLGNPNNCLHKGGTLNNVSYRPSKLNTLTGSVFTIQGIVYPWASDSLNGQVDLVLNADLSIRNIGYIGRNSAAVFNISGTASFSTKYALHLGYGNAGSQAIVNISGGSISPGTDLSIANGLGLTAQLNITGGAVNVTNGNLFVGAGGRIFISGVGMMAIKGDKTLEINSLINNGQLTTVAGKTLSVIFDGVNTIVRLPVNLNSMIQEFSDSVVLKTGNIVCVLDKNTGNIISYRFKGVETVANKPSYNKKYMYHDFTTSKGFETIWGCNYEIVQDSVDFAHVVFKRPYTPSIGHVTPCDAELHYALKKDDQAVYVYSKLEHKPNYPRFDLGSWRQVWWTPYDDQGVNLAERIYTDSLRSWEMPSQYDYSQSTGSGGPVEIVKLTTGIRSGKFDGKYEYSMKFWENPLWGHASNKNNIGLWCINASCEYYNEGPMYHELNAAAGIIHQCMNGVHYNAGGIDADTLTSWTKVFGPYLLMITDKTTGDLNWAAAKQRQLAERDLWPYNWVKDTVAYPLASKRGSITGKFQLSDALKSSLKGNATWIGVTSLADGATNFQFECKDYQYWEKTDAQGNFNIKNIRPGTYTLFAFSDSATGEFRMDNVNVTAGGITSLGTLTRTVDRNYGTLLWEIGMPNRMANEFKMGDFDYSEGMVQNKFKDSFPNPIEYNVSENNWAKKIPYVQTKYPDTAANANAGNIWKWRINFAMPTVLPSAGNARLTIAYAGNDNAQQWIYLNNENSLLTSYYPSNGGGNGFIRQTNYAKYSVKEILIPMNKFVPGNNILTLVMPSNQGWVSHIMYDYISLEANVKLPAINISSSTSTICAGASVQFNATTTNGGISPVFQWRVNGVNVGSGASTYSTSSLNHNDRVTCSVKSDLQGLAIDTAISNSISIAVNSLPSKPVLSLAGQQLSLNATYNSYQWYQNDVMIANATSSTFSPLVSGNYKVRVTNVAGCEIWSDAFSYTVTGVLDIRSANGYQIYPTVSKGTVTVDLGKSPRKKVAMSIVTMDGRIVERYDLQISKKDIDTRSFKAGLYYVLIYDGDKIYRGSFVCTKQL